MLQNLNGLYVTEQFVCYDDTGLAITCYEAFWKAFCRLGATVFQDEKVRYIVVDQNDDFVEVPFVSTAWSFAPDAIREMTSKSVHPKLDRFPADDHAALANKSSISAVLKAKR